MVVEVLEDGLQTYATESVTSLGALLILEGDEDEDNDPKPDMEGEARGEIS